jgi:hypothetical protein
MKSKKLKKPAQVRVARLGCPSTGNLRKPSHIPLTRDEREKLYKGAAVMGLPYATWARATLLIVADWPAERQPIRGGNTSMAAMIGNVVKEGGEDRQTSMNALVPGFEGAK